MYKTNQHTLFMGKNIVFVPECPSTNDLAMSLLQQPAMIEGTVVITNCQTAGRGQRGNTWITEPGQNLTFSVVLKPTSVSVKNQFYLTMATALAVYDYLTGKTDKPVYIKWPNDVLVEDKKICGILIESIVQGNVLKGAVAGIGLNINQKEFSISTATSLKNVTGLEFDLPHELNSVLALLEKRYLQLKQSDFSGLHSDYLNTMYRIHQLHLFKSHDESLEGSITGIDETGRLLILCKGGMRSFGVKEITFQ